MHRNAAALEILLGPALLFLEKTSAPTSTNCSRGVLPESEGLLNNLLTLDALIAIKTGSDSSIFAVV